MKNDKRKYYLPFVWVLFIAITLITVFLLGRSCQPETIQPTEKKSIKTDLIKKDSIHKEVVYKDSVREVMITRWRTVKQTIPAKCDTVVKTIIQACDTVIMQDSSLIASMKAEQAKSDTIIKKLIGNARVDSNTIVGLKKEVRRQKWQKRGILLLWGIREGVGVAGMVMD